MTVPTDSSPYERVSDDRLAQLMRQHMLCVTQYGSQSVRLPIRCLEMLALLEELIDYRARDRQEGPP